MVGVGEELVVIELADEGDLVRVLARHRAEHAEGRRDRVAASFDRELDDVLAVEVDRVRREGRPRGVLDALVDGQDREVPGAREPAVVEHRFDAPQDPGRPVAVLPDAVDEVAAWDVELVFRHRLAAVLEEVAGVRAQQLFEPSRRRLGNCCHHRLLHI